MARFETGVHGQAAVGPAEAGFTGTAVVGWGPGTPARWGLIWFAAAVAYILIVTYAAARR